MQSRRVLLAFVTSLVVLTCSGLAFSHHHTPPVTTTSGPVQAMDYDVTTDILLGLPNDSPPISSFLRDPLTVDLPAPITGYPIDPCFGIAQVWNAVLADPALGHHERRVVLGLVIQTMATNQCEAQIVRDESVVPPTMVSFQPIPPP